ncbi:hypothetical protein Acy02nite_72590 [Actinoplanes cyaneus]|uniref:Uncharacterized protein n=1 Tax=Actinoplanes cyaneus TaxID=52696 RepID=A0A919IQ21_9ACTN|nr:hypothetical protein Acy02nite_72590 [Actinoplanes cyaneus]
MTVDGHTAEVVEVTGRATTQLRLRALPAADAAMEHITLSFGRRPARRNAQRPADIADSPVGEHSRNTGAKSRPPAEGTRDG